MSVSPDVEVAVVGAGVVGLAVAEALARRGHEVLVLERQPRAGLETSTHNSEVIHAGLYYPPGSLKARLCVDGNRRLYRFAAENGVPVRRYGKLLVATHAAEVAALEAISANARQCGVDDLVPLTAREATGLEPEIRCVAAVLSPSTGVIDSPALVAALEGHLAAAGGSVVFNADVVALARRGDGTFEIAVRGRGTDSRLSARRLVLAAGLGTSRLAATLAYPGDYTPPPTYIAKGHYFAFAGRPPFRHLVYPLPARGSLGVHVTLDVGGAVRFGPDISWTEVPSYQFEDADGTRRRQFEEAIRQYWPGLPEGALAPGYTGLRPKLTRAGEPAADFAIHGPATHAVPGLVALYGIESPGLTSCLAIAGHVAQLVDPVASPA